MSFQILEHVDKLSSAKEKGRYICPKCQGDNLTIGKDGAYRCWNGCDCSAIREAIAPRYEREQTTGWRCNPSQPKKQSEPASAPEKIKLARLPQTATDSPQPQKPAFIPKNDKIPQGAVVREIVYDYGEGKTVHRFEWDDPKNPKGYDKTFRQRHINLEGLPEWKKGDEHWSAYRLSEAIAVAKASGSVVFSLYQEGEGGVEIVRQHGLGSSTFQGSNWSEESICQDLFKIKTECPNIRIMPFLPDNDDTGQKKAETFRKAVERAGLIPAIIDPVAIYPELPDKGDIKEILAAMNPDEFIRQLEDEIHKAVEARRNDRQLEGTAVSTDPDERLKLELQALQQESDPFKKARQRARIASHYRISKQEIQELLKHLEQKSTTPQKTWYSFDEFFNEESEAIKWVVPQLLPRGETLLLAAQAKCGKTTLATDIMYAVLSGGTVIGEQVGLKGKVLLISSDESPNSTRRRMRLRGFDLLDERSNFQVTNHLDITNLTELEAKLEDFRPDLVVIDSLTTICSEVGISEKDPEFVRHIYKLKSLLGRYNAACILIHHENKDPLAKGINQVSGSARIPAAVWGILQLKAVNPNDDSDSRRWLKIKPREGEAITLKLQLNPKDTWLRDGIWTCMGELGDESGEKKTQGDRVLDLLRRYSPKGLTRQEIDNTLNIGKSLYIVLDRLEDRQLVTKRKSEFNNRQWVYAVPQSEGDTPPPSVDQAGGVEKPESIAKFELQQFNNQFNTNSTPIQQPIFSAAVLNSQNQDRANVSTPIQQLDDQRGGEGVLSSTNQLLNSENESAIATPTSTTDSPIQQGEVSQLQPTPMPINKDWYVGQRVLFWLGVGRRWAEGMISQVHNDPATNFFKVVVETADGFWQNVWQESHLMPFPLQEAKNGE